MIKEWYANGGIALGEIFSAYHRAELPKITPHVCRHTYCSHMASSGVNPKHLQYLMGHSEISVTLDVYTHVDWDNLRGDINFLNIDEERNGYSVMA